MYQIYILLFLSFITYIHAVNPFTKINKHDITTRHIFKSSSLLSQLSEYHVTNVEMRLHDDQPFKSFSPSHAFHSMSLNSLPYYPDTLQLRMSIPLSFHTTSTSTSTSNSAQQHVFTLVRHTELFSADYATHGHVYDDNGVLTHIDTYHPGPMTSWHCYYRGVDTRHDLALSLCNGVSGVLVMNGKHVYIEPAHQHLQSVDAKSSGHVIFHKLEDTVSQNLTCGVIDPEPSPLSTSSSSHSLSDSHSHHAHAHTHTHAHAHDRHLTGIAQTYVEVLAVNDHTRLKKIFLDDRNTMEQDTAQTISVTDLIYRGINDANAPTVRVVLVGQVTFLIQDPYTIDPSGCSYCAPGEIYSNQLLKLFTDWDYNHKTTNQAHDNAQLLSGYDFENATVGLAGIGTMCAPSGSTSVVQATFTAATNAATSAHEMGHNWGMIHDGTNNTDLHPPVSNTCHSTGFVMAAYACTQCSNSATPQFSTCSPTEMTKYYVTGQYMTNNQHQASCVDNVPSFSLANATCQNGLVEKGEACDCGQADCSSIDPCCDGTTCQLKAGKQCSKLDGCCSPTCTFLPANTVCRAAANPCDVPETCSGTSGKCPADAVYGAGYTCPSGICYTGICRSKTQQCSLMNPINTWIQCSAAAESFVYSLAQKESKDKGITEPSICGRLFCRDKRSSDTASCSYPGFPDPSQAAVVANFPYIRHYDGMPCGNGNQCLGGVCSVASQLMTSLFQWNIGPWIPSTCTDCTSRQIRNVTCVDQRSFNNGTVANNAACSPFDQPTSSQLCRSATCPGDTVAPVISNCPGDMTFSSNGNATVKITWDEPTYHDNEDQAPLRVFQTYHPGDTFATDTSYYIQYNVWDGSGNMATCGFTATIQSDDLPGDGSLFGIQKKYIYIIVACAGGAIFICCVFYYCCNHGKGRNQYYEKSEAQQKLEQRRAERDARASQARMSRGASMAPQNIELEGR